MKWNNKKGFTLVEMLVGVALVGIVIGTIMATGRLMQKTSSDVKADAQFISATDSLKRYLNHKQSCLSIFSGLDLSSLPPSPTPSPSPIAIQVPATLPFKLSSDYTGNIRYTSLVISEPDPNNREVCNGKTTYALQLSLSADKQDYVGAKYRKDAFAIFLTTDDTNHVIDCSFTSIECETPVPSPSPPPVGSCGAGGVPAVVSAAPAVLPPNIDLFLNTPHGYTVPTDTTVTGLAASGINFTDIGPPTIGPGNFWYPTVNGANQTVEIEPYVIGETNVAPPCCRQVNIRRTEGGSYISPPIAFGGPGTTPQRPKGTVGIYSVGFGGAQVMVKLTTNWGRVIKMSSRYNRWWGNQSPFIITNGTKVVTGWRARKPKSTDGNKGSVDVYATTIQLEPGEVADHFEGSYNTFDSAGCCSNFYTIQCD